MQNNNERTGFLLCEYPPLHGSYLRRQAELSPWGSQNNKRAAFTLAEVLITLGIIGVVAAVTLPALITNVQSRIRAEQIRSAKYKFTLATDKMNSLGLIGPYDSTEAFVKELQRHLKLAKVCPPGKLEGCWPTKDVKLDSDGTKFEINKATTGKQFRMENSNTSDYTSSNIGIVTADGVPMIISYNKKCEPLDPVKEYAWTTEDNKPVSNATAGCVAAVMDINGSKKPNKLGEDVVLFNARSLGSGCAIETGGVCFSSVLASYQPMTRSECEAEKEELGIKACGVDTDYWAGAVKACGGVKNMPSLDDIGKLGSLMYKGNPVISGVQTNNIICDNDAAQKLGLPLPCSGLHFWSSNEGSPTASYTRHFASFTSDRSYLGRGTMIIRAVCLIN